MITLLILMVYGLLIYAVFVIAGSLLWEVLKLSILFIAIAIVYRAITGKKLV